MLSSRSSLRLSSYVRCSSSFIFVALCLAFSGMPVSLLYWRAQNWTWESSVWPHQCWAEWKDLLRWPADNTLPNAAQGTNSLLCRKNMFLAHVQPGAHQDPQVLFCHAPFQLGGPPAYTGVWSCSSPGAGFCAISCWTLMSLSACFSSLSRSPLDIPNYRDNFLECHLRNSLKMVYLLRHKLLVTNMFIFLQNYNKKSSLTCIEICSWGFSGFFTCNYFNNNGMIKMWE